MKKIMMLFMFIIVLSGTAYSKTNQVQFNKGYDAGYSDGKDGDSYNNSTKGNKDYQAGYTSGYNVGSKEASESNESTTTETTASESSESTTTETTASESSESTTTETTASGSSDGSKIVYLVAPVSATDIKYYAVDSSGNTLTVTEKTKKGDYYGDSDLNLITLSIDSSDLIKLVAGYKQDDEYYFLVSEDADSDDADELMDFYDGSASWTYSASPGIRIKEDVRLSMIPVNSGTKNITEISETVSVKGDSGINPNSSDDKEFYMLLKDGSEYGLKKNSDKEYNLYSITGKKFVDTLSFENVTSLKFTSKDIPSKDSDKIAENVLKINGSYIKNNETYILEGNMKAEFVKGNGGNGKWSTKIDGTTGSGETIVLLEDKGTVASSGIDVESKVSSKSRKRDTRLETSIIDSENFVIESIEE